MTPVSRASALAPAPLALAIGLLAGCGEDERPAADPELVLEEASAAASTLTSGEIEVRAELRLEAEVDRLSRSQGFDLGGPFEREAGEPPRFDLGGSIVQAGGSDRRSEVDFGLIATADSAYLRSGDEVYEAAPVVFRRFASLFDAPEGRGGGRRPALDLAAWFADASDEGTESIDGVEVVHVAGAADAERLFGDLEAVPARLGQRAGIDLSGIVGVSEEATIDLYAGAEDRVPRRIELEAGWSGRLEGGEPFDGTYSLSVEVREVDEPQEVEVPEAARPLRGSVEELPFQLQGLGELLGGTAGPPSRVAAPSQWARGGAASRAIL